MPEARYDTGAGEAIFMVAEVDEALQYEGWPAFCLASLDLGCGKMICRSTSSDISGNVVRWLPVDVSFKQEEAVS
ncbi:hypothetical protein [Serratia liquefaciens]